MKVFLVQIMTDDDDHSFTYIGLNAIAGYLENNNVDYRLLKGNVNNVLNDIEKGLDQSGTNIIGINVMTSRYKETMHFIQRLRNSNKFSQDTHIIAGGAHFTLLPESLPSSIDCAVIGDGEETFLELVKTPREKWKTIKGIAYCSGNEVRLTPPRELLNLDKLPFPRFECSKFKVNGRIFNATAIATSRGCPYMCIYCNVNTLHKKVRFNSAQYIFNLIKDRADRGCDMIMICDDLFVGNKPRLRELVGLLNEAKLKVNFWIMGVRANLVDEELVTNLRQLGVIHANVGLESGSDRILKKLKNAVRVSDNYRAIRLLHKSGITSYCMFMLGHPDETIQDIKATLRLIKSPYVRSGQVFITTPMPKTQLWYDCGFDDSISDWEDLDFVYGCKKNICKHLTKNQLRHYQEKATKIIARKKLVDRIKGILGSAFKR